jgi:hypothetical protein
MIATPYLLSSFPKKDDQVKHSLSILHISMSAIIAPHPMSNRIVIGFIRKEPFRLEVE